MYLRENFTIKETQLIEKKLESLNLKIDKYKFYRGRKASIKTNYDTNYVMYEMIDAYITLTILRSYLNKTSPIYTVISSFDYTYACGHEVEIANSFTLLKDALNHAENTVLKLCDELYITEEEALQNDCLDANLAF